MIPFWITVITVATPLIIIAWVSGGYTEPLEYSLFDKWNPAASLVLFRVVPAVLITGVFLWFVGKIVFPRMLPRFGGGAITLIGLGAILGATLAFMGGFASCTNSEGSGPGPRRGAPELSIEVSPANISLVVGESVRVEATVTEFNATYPKYGKIHYSPPASWDSSDPNVATVSGMEAHAAIVTAVSAGTTKIFARWMWGVGVLEITVRAKPSEP